MKKLSEVTEEDAKQIIKAGYPLFFEKGNWQFKDNSEEMKEPCKLLYSRFKEFDFTFYDDNIRIYNSERSAFRNPFDSAHFDTLVECFVEAHNLGYHVTKFDKLKALKPAL